MRVLGIETSTRRGSVAAVLDGAVIGALAHEEQGAHAERVLSLIEVLLGEVGWTRATIDRIAVGIGPGSFTGLRVGIALAQGMALGLGRPLVGVGSLATLAHQAPSDERRIRVPLLDARRGELFVAAYDASGTELLAPAAVPIARVTELLGTTFGSTPYVLIGEAARLLGPGPSALNDSEAALPDATATARLGSTLDPSTSPAEPLYVRGPGATPQNLPPSPLA